MLTQIFLICFLSLASAQLVAHDPNYCFYTDPLRPQRLTFGIHTHYDDVRGNELFTRLSTCTPVKSWVMSRGGMRLPSASTLNTLRSLSGPVHGRVTQAMRLGRSQLCRSDADNIQRWTFNESLTNDRENELTQTGWYELRNLASRLQIAFPQVFPRTYNEAQFRFRHTYRQRTADSARAFAEGLFGHSNVVLDVTPDVDRLLRPIDSCHLYDEFVSNTGERDAYREGPDFMNMMEEVNQKLGLRGSNQLTLDELQTIVDNCRYEQGRERDLVSAWCGAFSVANHQLFEYDFDLFTYYTSGYGGDESLFRNLKCHAFQDLLQFFNSTGGHLSRIHVGHSNIINLFLVTLGAIRDETPLTRHNIAQQFDRRWRTSHFSPMSMNLVFVQHQCDGGDNDLVIYFNERPLTIPGCEAAGVCKQSTFIRLFERFLNVNCDDLFCSRN